MNLKPSIIIMMSTFNGGRYLERQLQSIANQNADAIVRLFVRDDGSTDNTLSLLKKWAGIMDLTIISDKDSLGSAQSFWRLLQNVPAGDYYAFVDQDDEWDSDKLEVAIKNLQKHQNIPTLWCSNYRLIDENGSVLEKKHFSNPPKLTPIAQLVCGSIQGCSMLFNRSAKEMLDVLPGCDFPMHDIAVMEYTLIRGKVIFDEVPRFSYRVHSNNVVAKAGKSKIKQIHDSLHHWFGKKTKYEISRFSRRLLLDNKSYLSETETSFLKKLSSSRTDFGARFSVIRSQLVETENMRALRSFKIRVLLGII